MIWRRFFRSCDRGVASLPQRKGEKTSLSKKSYEEEMDEVTRWNVENTDILRILRDDVADERLLAWSEALSKGIRKVIRRTSVELDTAYDNYLDLYKFIIHERIKLVKEPSMEKAKGTADLDPITVCIVCGIRALQQEFGLPGLMSTMRLKLLQRYFERMKLPSIGGIS
ncbi:MAG: hypothetical protein DRG50_07775 [Deltaproteobacteria bacterium]|nr:MAG: hypothetical protein DRG50_07775 [Deltaproteobacteria bacterium]